MRLNILQVNKHNKSEYRAFCVTDKFVYKLDPKKAFHPMKRGISVTDVSKYSDSSTCFCLLVIAKLCD